MTDTLLDLRSDDDLLPARDRPPPPDERTGARWSRRQVGLLALGAAALAPVARLLGIGEPSTTSSLAADGTVVTRGRGSWTSFGTVAVLRAERQPRLGGDPEHPGHAGEASLSPEPGNRTWADRVVLEVEVHNGTDLPVLFSPGQVRLRVGSQGQTVTPEDADRSAGGLAAGATERVRISYLAPTGVSDLGAELSDPHLDDVLLLELPPVLWRPAPS